MQRVTSIIPVLIFFIFAVIGAGHPVQDYLGRSSTSPLYTCYTYMIVHKSVLHLIVNSTSYFFVSRMVGRLYERPAIPLFFAMSAAVIAAYFAAYEKPTIGASGLVYGYIGIFYALVVAHPKVKIVRWSKFYTFVACTITALTASAINSTSNFMLHLIALISGFLLMVIHMFVKNHINTRNEDAVLA